MPAPCRIVRSELEAATSPTLLPLVYLKLVVPVLVR